MESLLKMDDLGVPLFLETPISPTLAATPTKQIQSIAALRHGHERTHFPAPKDLEDAPFCKVKKP